MFNFFLKDWSDLIEYVINTFIKKPHSLQSMANFRIEIENFDEVKLVPKPVDAPETPIKPVSVEAEDKKKPADGSASCTSKGKDETR